MAYGLNELSSEVLDYVGEYGQITVRLRHLDWGWYISMDYPPTGSVNVYWGRDNEWHREMATRSGAGGTYFPTRESALASWNSYHQGIQIQIN